MENLTEPQPTAAEEISIFDDLKPLPTYYSDRAIYGFSILLGVLFGAILSAMNFNRTESKKGVWQVITFGILYTNIQLCIESMLPQNSTPITFAINFAGAYVLTYFFQRKYIGKDVPYTKRSVLVPTIIAIAIVVFFVFVVIFAKGQS